MTSFTAIFTVTSAMPADIVRLPPRSTSLRKRSRKKRSSWRAIPKARAIVDFFKKLDREVRTATNNNVDLTIVVAVDLIETPQAATSCRGLTRSSPDA